MRRKKPQYSERAGKDRWLISYADFITLLLAFFVVMYSASSINNGKYEALANVLQQTFPQTLEKLDALSVEEATKFIDGIENKNNTVLADLLSHTDLQASSLMIKLNEEFKVLISDKKIHVKNSEDWLEIEIGSNMLFNTGSSFLNNDAEFIIRKLAQILMASTDNITIEGFTDNIPIHNTIYPSNWELSTDRASAVARAFISAGIEAKRLAVTGYGENFPLTDNKTENGRQQNRRIVIVVEKDNKRKKYLAILRDGEKE